MARVIMLVTVAVLLCIVKRGVVESQGVMLKTLPASKLQLQYMVPFVCDTLFAFQPDEESKIANCTEDFPNFFGVSSMPSELQIVCHTQDDITFSMPTSMTKQLVILIPDDVDGIINTVILDAGEELGIISIDFPKSTIWTTELKKDGTPSIWKRGPHVPLWVPKKENNRLIIFSHKFDYKKIGLHKIDAIISWKMDGASCSDVTVENVCFKNEDGNYFRRRITASTQSVIVSDLPLNENCNFTLKQDGFQRSHVYKTPSCEDLDGCIELPDIPQDIYIEASKANEGESRVVYVSWAPPRRDPDVYNVTLRADDVRSVIVSGNATDVTFTDIFGTGYYNVSIQAITASGKALTSRRALFPGRTEWSSRVLTLVAGACAVAGLAVTAVWWRRRRAYKLAHIYFQQGLEDKLPKECNSETGQESGVEDSWEVRPERLLLHEVIGEGAFGVVRKGTLAPGGKEVAVKMLKDFPSLDEIRSFRAEMELMKSVGAHPHVVSLVGCCSGRRPLIIAEYCNRGDLLSYLRCCWDIIVSKRNAKYYNNNIETADYRNDPPKPQREQSRLVVNKLYDLHGSCDVELTSLDLLSFCRQIAMGMEFLSLNRVVHRDLAARNILISGDRMLKIADFGLSRDVYQENQYKQKGNGKMPVKWMALESLTHRIYTTQSDVWSFGVVVWEVVTVGGAPYPEVPAARLPRLLRAGYRMPRPNNCSKQLYDIMQSCWRARPRNRPNFAELHQKLDELLNSACADEYLSLELEGADAPPTPRPQRYVKMILRSSRLWSKAESYERPLKAPQSNHYTSPPASITRVQAV